MQNRTLSAYVHVPFCASRCGYCDFNTYTATELTRDGSTVSAGNYASYVIQEIRQTKKNPSSIFHNDLRELTTVFFGGGTPTLLPAEDLVQILTALKSTFGLASTAEVTVEANPDSVDLEYLRKLKAGGFTRISFGHQSSSEKILQVLERTHTAGRTWAAVDWANQAGFENVSVDLIYASPLETEADLQKTLTELAIAISTGKINHVSAYSLIVEPGTRMASKISRGELPNTDDDVAATRYEMIDRQLSELGLNWYEVSNWAKPGGECLHNIAYWKNQDWLGIGPGAHAHNAGVRQWKVKHPAAWTSQLVADRLPIADQEELSVADTRRETIMLGLRLKQGLDLAELSAQGQEQARLAVTEGLLETDAFGSGLAVLTFRGRLLADGLVARLWD